MDQEDFEEIASMGEHPVSSLRPVIIPAAAESGDDNPYSHYFIHDNRSGQILLEPTPERGYLFFNDCLLDINDGAGAVPDVPASSSPSDV